jgi:hypothetical protein
MEFYEGDGVEVEAFHFFVTRRCIEMRREAQRCMGRFFWERGKEALHLFLNV